MKINYQKELDNIIENLDKKKHYKLLLHSCCGPCSSYVIEYLSEYFDITIFYYNPNISPREEYLKRKEEQLKLINEIKVNKRFNINMFGKEALLNSLKAKLAYLSSILNETPNMTKSKQILENIELCLKNIRTINESM